MMNVNKSSVVVLNVITLSVILLNVVAPQKDIDWCRWTIREGKPFFHL